MTAAEAFAELVLIMARLRGPGGCPWDREQTHASIKPYLIEETYEVAEAIERGDDKEFRSELGDVLLQIVFHAQIAAERGAFTITDVVQAINEKLVRRHPHVFADAEVGGAADVLRNWSRIKAEERREAEDRSILAGVPRGMPALLRAQRLGEKAAHVGFDWENVLGVLIKMREEMEEIEAAVRRADHEAAAAELGDLLYAATSLARHLGAVAEDALHAAADQFVRRFRYIEEQLAQQQRDIGEATPADLDALWQEAKRQV